MEENKRITGKFLESKAGDYEKFEEMVEEAMASDKPYRVVFIAEDGAEDRRMGRMVKGKLVKKEGIFTPADKSSLQAMLDRSGEDGGEVVKFYNQTASTAHDDELFRPEGKGSKSKKQVQAETLYAILLTGKVGRDILEASAEATGCLEEFNEIVIANKSE